MNLGVLLVPPRSFRRDDGVLGAWKGWMIVEAKARRVHPGLPPSHDILCRDLSPFVALAASYVIPVFSSETGVAPLGAADVTDTSNPFKDPGI